MADVKVIKVDRDKPSHVPVVDFPQEKLDMFLRKFGDEKDVRCAECKMKIRVYSDRDTFWVGINGIKPEFPKIFCEKCANYGTFGKDRSTGRPEKYYFVEQKSEGKDAKRTTVRNWGFQEQRLTDAFLWTWCTEDMKNYKPVKDLSPTERIKHIIRLRDYELLKTLTNEELEKLINSIVEAEPSVVSSPSSPKIQKLYLWAYNNAKLEQYRRGSK